MFWCRFWGCLVGTRDIVHDLSRTHTYREQDTYMCSSPSSFTLIFLQLQFRACSMTTRDSKYVFIFIEAEMGKK